MFTSDRNSGEPDLYIFMRSNTFDPDITVIHPFDGFWTWISFMVKRIESIWSSETNSSFRAKMTRPWVFDKVAPDDDGFVKPLLGDVCDPDGCGAVWSPASAEVFAPSPDGAGTAPLSDVSSAVKIKNPARRSTISPIMPKKFFFFMTPIIIGIYA